ncbi:MAG: calcium:proton antiporter [Francisellaceae bacterium]
MSKLFRYSIKESGLLIALVLFILLWGVGDRIAADSIPNFFSYLLSIIIFVVMLICSFNVVKQADWLAERFGEPYGTLILTLAVISIEVALIITVMLAGKGEPTLARDTMFAVIMIAINGFAGLSLLTGGIKHYTQMYNIEGASAYLAVLIPLATICLILPNYTVSTTLSTLSNFQSVIVIIICVALYATFLVKQTITHKDYFQFSIDREEDPHHPEGRISYHVICLLAGLMVMILLSKYLAAYLQHNIEDAGLPRPLVGFIIAMLVLMPEGVSAIQSAYKNRLQRSINLCMGSALATICLTVPSVLIISLFIGQPLILGLQSSSLLLLVLTFFSSVITFSTRRTSVLNGVVHLSIFMVYFVLIFDVI